MNFKTLVVVASGISMAVSGCSSRPRPYAPTLAIAPFDQRAFDQANAECSKLLVAGKLDQNGRLGSAGVGAATGAGVAAGGVALATSTVPAVGMALASATLVLIPFAVIGGAVSMAKIKRAKKEKAIKTAMAGCLKERGYEINGWTKMSKTDIDRANAAKGATAAVVPPGSN